MAAPKGNRFWELWEKERDKKYTSESLWDKAIEYFEYFEENPLQEQDWVGKDAFEVIKNKMRAMSITSFCGFCGISLHTFLDYEKSESMVHIVTRIRSIIYSQKFEGAAAGLLNPSIISRELGLVDKKDVSITAEQPLFSE